MSGSQNLEFVEATASNSRSNPYPELRRIIKDQGLLNKQPGYYIFKIVTTLALLALSITLLVVWQNTWLLLANAALLAFVFSQLGFIGHDAGHGQIFRSNRRNDITGLIISLLLGMERSWWVNKHNRHHSNPNQTGLDPDIDIPILAFTRKEALRKRGLYRYIVKYQHYFFYLMLALSGGFGLRLAGVRYLLHNKVKYPLVEPLFMAGHFVVYLGLLFYLLDPWHVILFIAVHQLVFGFQMGSVFAPNHKGMPILDKGDQMDYLRQQVITARNIKPNPVIDLMYGGLNYQIEHHLFPDMPRNKLGEAQKIVKAFCLGHSIPYHETSVLQSQREILGCLQRASAPLRGGRR